MHITFYGAAGEVTGSSSLVEASGLKILVDCGMFQGSDKSEAKNAEPLPFNPRELTAVAVTHAHLDHVGRLPLLAKGGFMGNFYATAPTIELAKITMEDTVNIMTHDHQKFGRPILYTEADVADVMARFKQVEYGEPMRIERNLSPTPRPPKGDLRSAEGRGSHPPSFTKEGSGGGHVTLTFHDAGHIFGSSFIEIQGENKKVVFSGDVGNINVPILRDTEMLPTNIDALVCESTYGDRMHESVRDRERIIEQMIAGAIQKGGVLLIPSFSIERTQELVYELNDLIDRQHKLPRIPIYVDSPMAIDAIKVFRKYPEYYDDQAQKFFRAGDDLFDFPGLTLTYTREESMKINHIMGPKIIIAGAGMMNGGRILHHAIRYLSDKRNTLLIIGYQAYGTLGRDILEGKSPVNVNRERVEVRCQVKSIGALSAHGDQEKLLDWIGGSSMLPKKVFLNHGEPKASDVLAKRIRTDLGAQATVVSAGLTVTV